jgi:UDP-N-acetylmuramate dehydrogenase
VSRLLQAAGWDPAADPAAVAAVAARLERAGLPLEREAPLAGLTTLRVGGAAAVLVRPADPAQLGAVLGCLSETTTHTVPLLVLGRGSNLLVSDAGFPGVALRLGAGFKWLHRRGQEVSAGAAEAMPALASWLAQQGLAGLEFAAGIPGSVGGAVRMNAGAHGGQTGDLLVEVQLAGADGEGWVPAGELALGYRQASLPARSVVTAARWRLNPDRPDAIRDRLDELRAWRRATQPLRQRNCGSVFTNPAGDSAGRLIEAAGLKGARVGGASVSPLHANFVAVEPGGRAADVHALIALVQRRVLDAGGPLLVPEVRVIGRFDADRAVATAASGRGA